MYLSHAFGCWENIRVAIILMLPNAHDGEDFEMAECEAERALEVSSIKLFAKSFSSCTGQFERQPDCLLCPGLSEKPAL